MNERALNDFKTWFSRYCSSFYSANGEDQKNIVLKEDHTDRVCANMRMIAGDLGLEKEKFFLAECIALFHDVGRFEQYREYKTFKDSISTNHATLGARVLEENNVLADMPESEREMVLRVVALHNVFSVPEKLDEETLLFVKMIRDADKLDIWRVFIDYYAQAGADRPNAAGLGLPDGPDYTQDVLASLAQRKMVHLSSLRTLNDFKLLQLAWIFDLNFKRSLLAVRERSLIDKIAAALPQTMDIGRAVDSIREYVDRTVCAGRSNCIRNS